MRRCGCWSEQRLYCGDVCRRTKCHFKGHGCTVYGIGHNPDRRSRLYVAPKAIDKMYHHFNQNFGYHYTPEAFAGVGQLYVSDPRFTENVDQYGEGLSQFLAEAMRIYAESQA